MTLSPIGDIAQPTLSEASDVTLTWETTTDWSNYSARETALTNNIGTRNASGEIRIGYDPNYAPLSTKGFGYWPLDATSGGYPDEVDTYDGTVNGGTRGNTGIWGGNSWESNGGNDHVNIGTLGSFGSQVDTNWAISLWVRLDINRSASQMYYGNYADANRLAIYEYEFNQYRVDIGNGDIQRVDTNPNTATAGSWVLLILNKTGPNASDIEVWEDATSLSTSIQENDDISPTADFTEDMFVGAGNNGGGSVAFQAPAFYSDLIFFDSSLTRTEINNLYKVGSPAFLTTGTKSFGSSQKPDLQNLDYTLNSETITLDVIGSPGTASEEIVSQTLDGAASYSLTWSNSHTDFRIKSNLEVASPTAASPQVNRLVLVS